MTCIFATDDDATRWALEWLRRQGFVAHRREDYVWHRPRELRAIYGLAKATLHKRLNHRACPVTPRDYGPAGSILWVAMSPELDKWLRLPLQMGVALSASEA